MAALSEHLTVVFPVHPRTRKRLDALAAPALPNSRLRMLQPIPYLEFLALQQRAALVITDSGGIQEETTFLRVPCLTVRENTERPITITHGTNQLVGRDLQKLRAAATKILDSNCGTEVPRAGKPAITHWDGHASERIAAVILRR
jgi:UDP-N-acetylglucosamine 2-epimerase (non-hydrolysing)